MLTLRAYYHQRLNPSAVSYLQDVFALALRQQLEPVCERLPLGVLAPFARVLLEDSTQCRLHAKLAEAFKGSGGSASTSALQLDVIYEVLHHSLVEVHLSDGTAADQSRALAIVPHLRPNDLVLRDLGYLSLKRLRQIETHGAMVPESLKQRDGCVSGGSCSSGGARRGGLFPEELSSRRRDRSPGLPCTGARVVSSPGLSPA